MSTSKARWIWYPVFSLSLKVEQLEAKISVIVEDLDCATKVRCKNLQAIVEIEFEAEEPRKAR